MTKAARINEMLEAMPSFGKAKYQKSELLSEMLALQNEIVRLTFNDAHATTANLRIWDVEKHLEQMNKDCGNVADEALQIFMDESKTLCNLIKAEISGARGEAKAFRTLEYLKNKARILKNVELSDENHRTELDVIVIMPEVITIVEVKNTARNIFIDENGDYFRTGEFLKWDCNIAYKMQLKEELLRKAIERTGITNIQIKSVVVFADNRIEVQNKCSSIRTCFASQLAYILDGFQDNQSMTNDEMQKVEVAIREAETQESYPFGFNVAQYKRDFVTLMVTLEEAASMNEASDQKDEEHEMEKENVWSVFKNFLKSKYAGYLGGAAAAATLTIVSTTLINSIRKGGFFR